MAANRLHVHRNLPMSLIEPLLLGGGRSKLSTERNCLRSIGTVLSGSGSIQSSINLRSSFDSPCIGACFISQ